MKTLILTIPVLCLLAGCASGPTLSGTEGTSTIDRTGVMASTDMAFLRQAAQAGLADVAIGQLAVQRAQNPAIRSLGETLVQDHTQLNQRIMQLAQEKRVDVPRALDTQHQQKIDRLSTLKGEEFDQVFRREVAEMHREDIRLFEQAAQRSPDSQIRALATKSLPVLRQHLEMAQSPVPTGTRQAPRQTAP